MQNLISEDGTFLPLMPSPLCCSCLLPPATCHLSHCHTATLPVCLQLQRSVLEGVTVLHHRRQDHAPVCLQLRPCVLEGVALLRQQKTLLCIFSYITCIYNNILKI